MFRGDECHGFAKPMDGLVVQCGEDNQQWCQIVSRHAGHADVDPPHDLLGPRPTVLWFQTRSDDPCDAIVEMIYDIDARTWSLVADIIEHIPGVNFSHEAEVGCKEQFSGIGRL